MSAGIDAARLGLVLGQGNHPLPDCLALATRADAAGLGFLAVGDGFVENASVMGALAAVTTRAELVTSIVGWTRTPVATALAGRTLQELSGGRYRLGLGPMPRAWSEDWHDIEASRPVARMRDFVAAVRTAWTAQEDAPVSHEGPYYRFKDYAPIAPGPPPPPVSLAATRPNMARLAGEVADGVLCNLITPPGFIADVLLPAVAEGRVRAGREAAPFQTATLAYCAIDDDVEHARDRVRPALAFYFAVPYFGDVLRHLGFERELREGEAAVAHGDRAAMAAAVSDAMVDAFALAGPLEDVRAGLERYLDVLDAVLLSPPIVDTSGTTHALAERVLDLVG